jgi:predicted alpha/beta-fold hydrolase
MNVVDLFGVKVYDENEDSELNVSKVFDIYDIIKISERVTEDGVLHKIKQYHKKKEKALQYYEKIYKNCLYKINKVIENDKFDVLFTIPEFNNECKYYNSIDCLDYIQTKLKKIKFDTKILSNTDIYISWFKLTFKS